MFCFVDNICFHKSFVSGVFVFLFLFSYHIQVIADPNDFLMWPKWTVLFFQYIFAELV